MEEILRFIQETDENIPMEKEEAAKRQLGHIEDYDVLTDEAKHYIHPFNRLHRKKIAKETKAMANAPRDTQRVLRGYLPAAQSAGPTYLAPVGNQPNARGTQLSESSNSVEVSSGGGQQSAPQSTARSHENPSREEDQDEKKNEDCWSVIDRLDEDMDHAYKRIRALEVRVAEMQPAAAASAAPAPSPVAVPSDIDQRVSRLEAKIAGVGQNGAEQRENISARVTEFQSLLLRFENRFGNLENHIEKVVAWNDEWKVKEKKRFAELDEKLVRLEAMERRLKAQKDSVETALEVLLEKTNDLPPVATFAASQEEKKRLKAVRERLQEARSNNDNA